MLNELIADVQLNDAGEVALKCYPMQQVLVQHTPSGAEYLFSIRANIALAWVDMQDVDNILPRTKKGCCPGSSAYRFMYANEADVRRWQNGGGS